MVKDTHYLPQTWNHPAQGFSSGLKSVHLWPLKERLQPILASLLLLKRENTGETTLPQTTLSIYRRRPSNHSAKGCETQKRACGNLHPCCIKKKKESTPNSPTWSIKPYYRRIHPKENWAKVITICPQCLQENSQLNAVVLR